MSIKDIIKRSFLGAYLVRRWRARIYRGQNRETVFSEIYRKNAWGSGESISGPGSELLQTATIRKVLPDLLRQLHVETFLDASCGDFHWMNEVDLGPIRYIGADIVPEMIAENQRRYARPGREFMTRDITCDPLPASDFAMCRDCLMHLGYAEIHSALHNLCSTGARHLLLTTFTGTKRNADIGHGGWWPMNLQLPPFNLPSPLEFHLENTPDDQARALQKGLGLWKQEDVLQSLKH